ncbi:hypothetical protein [Bacillus sp. 1P02SD]|uniref:hypothetical protein n=1 Tax=Bacillus sp. 1P02SD TaxID=3132264 RepID=UPI0039A0ACFE
MTFNEIMALIMPSFIAMLFYIKVNKRSINVFQGICCLVLIMLCTNLLCYAILLYLKVDPVLFTMAFTIKYSLLAVFIALVIAVLYRLLELNVQMNIRVEENGKETD